MSNNLLTTDLILKEALFCLHQKLNFVPNITTDYDDQFAKEGAQIGNSIRIRRPVKYKSTTGATIATGTGADSQENKQTLTLSTQRHVPMRFSSVDRTLKIEEFSKRFIKPAVNVIAAGMEADALTMLDSVPNAVAAGTKVELADILAARKSNTDNLAPMDDRTVCLDTQANVDLVTDLKGLFHDQAALKKQYREGAMGTTAGYEFYENTLLPTHTSGAEAGSANYATNNATAQEGSYTNPYSMTLTVDTGTKTIAKGDVFTIAGVYRVHPETKESTGELMQFTVTGGDTGTASATSLVISPAIIASGGHQNVSNAAANDQALTFVGAASTTYKQSIAFHKSAFCLGSADLILPEGVDFKGRQVLDGISMRIIRDYDIVKDRFLCRLDVLYGYAPLYPELASKIWHT